MEHCRNINFPELAFTSPGIYSYTIKELTPSYGNWKTDNRVYRVIIRIVKDSDGNLVACPPIYPDGFPKFVNIYYGQPPQPPCDVCEDFEKLPFPSFLFSPPQKPEFMEIMESSPQVFDWEELVKEFLKRMKGC